MSDERPSQNCPTDVLRLLFETDPHLFRFISGMAMGESRPLMEIVSDEAPPRLKEARKHVHSVWHLFELPQEHQKTFNFSRIHPTLRRMCFFLPQNEVAPNMFSLPFWTNITHLHVSARIPVSSPSSPFITENLFATMSQLTYLAFGNLRLREDNVDIAVSRLIALLTPSITLCIMPVLPAFRPSPADRDKWNTIVRGELDERIVVYWHGKLDFTLSDPFEEAFQMDDIAVVESLAVALDGVKSFWELGEDKLRKRRLRMKMIRMNC
ncbi:hypothetical protein DL96DRAFT_1625361 [Flagelloscypha sp. PMI_526]|nr:hypothetical protein DL96DRAFT_1625361 [Flagelloscypha sp. PMI_526]